MRKQRLVSSLTTRFIFIKLALGRMPTTRQGVRVQLPFKKHLHGCRGMDPWLPLPRILLFLDTLRPRDTVGSEGVAAVCSGFLRTILGLVAETATVSLRTLAIFCPLLPDTFSPFNAN